MQLPESLNQYIKVGSGVPQGYRTNGRGSTFTETINGKMREMLAGSYYTKTLATSLLVQGGAKYNHVIRETLNKGWGNPSNEWWRAQEINQMANDLHMCEPYPMKVPCEDNGETFVAPIIDFERPGVKKRKAKVQAAATLYIQKKKLKTAQAPGGVTGGDPGVQSSHTVALPIMAATTDHEVIGGVSVDDTFLPKDLWDGYKYFHMGHIYQDEGMIEAFNASKLGLQVKNQMKEGARELVVRKAE
ncbi:hypothetical protein CYMTET_28288 [Cymbomonas tetramitiformis]|uniref:Uncharacterized protein n=1 Tax=Cymbomonas tetramitiformis TaxID=36881 RepID=A0AAE0KWD5_9CHLO|nr:hypothetical protein CYMTET_28288 [Cymbomonas tetramitiformis]